MCLPMHGEVPWSARFHYIFIHLRCTGSTVHTARPTPQSKRLWKTKALHLPGSKREAIAEDLTHKKTVEQLLRSAL